MRLAPLTATRGTDRVARSMLLLSGFFITRKDCLLSEVWHCHSVPRELKDALASAVKTITGRMADSEFLELLHGDELDLDSTTWRYFYRRVRQCRWYGALRNDVNFNQTVLDWSNGIYKKFCEYYYGVDSVESSGRSDVVTLERQAPLFHLSGPQTIMLAMGGTIFLYFVYQAGRWMHATGFCDEYPESEWPADECSADECSADECPADERPAAEEYQAADRALAVQTSVRSVFYKLRHSFRGSRPGHSSSPA